MLPQNVQNLLTARPKLIGAPKNKLLDDAHHTQLKTPTKTFKLSIIEHKETKPSQLSLGLHEYYKQPTQTRFIQVPVAKQPQIEQPQIDQDRIVNVSLKSIDSLNLEDELNDQPERLDSLECMQSTHLEKINYIVEEEKTKKVPLSKYVKFLIDVLQAELQRLDSHSQELEQFMGGNQVIFEQLRHDNTDIETQVKQMVQEKETEDRIRMLEDELNLDDHLRMKFDDKMDQQRFNDELNQFYDQNEVLYKYADQIMTEAQRCLMLQNVDETPRQYTMESSYVQQLSFINDATSSAMSPGLNSLLDRSPSHKKNNQQIQEEYLNQFKNHQKSRTIIKPKVIKTTKKK